MDCLEVADQAVESHEDLRVYQGAVELQMVIFEITKPFPRAETYSLIDEVTFQKILQMCQHVGSMLGRMISSHQSWCS